MAKLNLHSILRFGIVLLVCIIFSCMASPANSEPDIKIYNQVKECVEILPLKIYKYSNLTLFVTRWKIIKSTGYCGCKSALLSYRVFGEMDQHKTEIGFGVFSSFNHQEFTFVVNPDSSYNVYKSFSIHIQCANPN